jgi:tetratricopeptide (TPR) repeat protein
MAKTKPSQTSKSKSKSKEALLHTTNGTTLPKRPKKSVPDLLAESAAFIAQAEPDFALPLAQSAICRLETESSPVLLPQAICLLAEIHVELGEISIACSHFSRAISLDPEGSSISADAHLWLAQLNEAGGETSIRYYTAAISILRREITALEEVPKPNQDIVDALSEKRHKISSALCAMAEIYMTDLSFNDDAESKAEGYVTEALLVEPGSVGALQTFASVRISQLREQDARASLIKSMDMWKDLPLEDDQRPDFPTRVSLCRLLMEVNMLQGAMDVLEGLVAEDDQSVESWYLGGWCQVLMAEGDGGESRKEGARVWLRRASRLYDRLEYEDERLRDHTMQLISELNKELGPEENEEDEEDWEDEQEDAAAVVADDEVEAEEAG